MTKGRTPKTREGTITVGSIYGFKADMPLVEIEMAGFTQPKAQLTLAQAREIWQHLGEAIEAAQSDAFIVRFFRDTVAIDDQGIANVLAQFRQSRATLDRPGGKATITIDI